MARARLNGTLVDHLVAAIVPALIMVLRRPNEGELPARLERVSARLPMWIRGVSRSGGTALRTSI